MLFNTGLKNCSYKVSGSFEHKPLTGAQKISFSNNTAERQIKVRTTSITSYNETIETGKAAALEVAQLSVDFLVDVLGYSYENGILTENLKRKPTHFSLYYEVQSDTEPTRIQIYDCVCTKPDFDATTITNNPSVDTKKLKLIINPENFNGITGKISRSVTYSENATAYTSWFETTT